MGKTRVTGSFKVDLTPTWSGVMALLIAGLEDGSPTAKESAREELRRMARNLDACQPVIAAAQRMLPNVFQSSLGGVEVNDPTEGGKALGDLAAAVAPFAPVKRKESADA